MVTLIVMIVIVVVVNVIDVTTKKGHEEATNSVRSEKTIRTHTFAHVTNFIKQRLSNAARYT